MVKIYITSPINKKRGDNAIPIANVAREPKRISHPWSRMMRNLESRSQESLDFFFFFWGFWWSMMIFMHRYFQLQATVVIK